MLQPFFPRTDLLLMQLIALLSSQLFLISFHLGITIVVYFRSSAGIQENTSLRRLGLFQSSVEGFEIPILSVASVRKS